MKDKVKVKSLADVLLTFAREFLSGEENVVKHLALIGFKVEHKQTQLPEFDYALSNLALDLRYG